MANKTFGTLVHSVLENCQQNSSDTNSIHYHRARRFAMDVMRRIRKEEFWFSQADGIFISTAGGYEYDLGQSSALGTNVRRVKNVWTSDAATESASSADLTPSDDEGARQGDWNEVMGRVRTSTTNQSFVDLWAWYQRKLWVYPRLDGIVYLVIRYIKQQKIFDYTRTSSGWSYSVVNASGTETIYTGDGIDNTVDPDGWLENAFDLIVAGTCRDLYLGPYQAKDVKKSLAETWVARYNSEWDELIRETRLGQGRTRIVPYFMPGD